MFKLAYKFSILGLVLLVLATLGNSLIGLPYYWGDIQLTSKSLHLKEQTTQPRAYFIGSSIVYHGIDPTIFCELTNKPAHYAFNLGIDGGQAPKTFSILEALLEKKDTIDYIFFEIGSFDQMADHLFLTTKNTYYYRMSHLWMTIKYFYYSNYLERRGLRITHKLGLIAKHVATALESMFKIGMRKEIIQNFTYRELSIDTVANKANGYYPIFDKRNRMDKAAAEQLNSQLRATKNKFIAAYSTPSKQAEYNPILQEIYLDFIAKAKAKNIKLVYLYTPFECAFDSAFDSVPEINALFQALPAANKMDLANPNKYPEFYELANRWDLAHLNDAGTKLFTQQLSELTNQLPE